MLFEETNFRENFLSESSAANAEAKVCNYKDSLINQKVVKSA